MKKAKYILIEGSEGTGKGTQTRIIVDSLRSRGLKVLDTKEPGTPHSPLTMELRKIMLDSKYESSESSYLGLEKDLSALLSNESYKSDMVESAATMITQALHQIQEAKKMTLISRELISQSIRHIHIQKVIYPAFESYDYIIQDRGIISGLVYGVACGVDYSFIENCSNLAIPKDKKGNQSNVYNLYDQVLFFQGDVAAGLKRALSAKQEFKTGDAMENKGITFLEKVDQNFKSFYKKFKNVSVIQVEGKSIIEVSEEVFKILV
jgi:thymidylate kinase